MLLLAAGEYPLDRVEPGTQQGGQVLDEQGQRDVKGVAVGLRRDVQAQRLHHLGEKEDGGDLLQDEGALTAPPVMQAEEFFDGQEREFKIPALGVQARDIDHGQFQRIEDIDAVHAQPVAIAKAHQAHWPTGAGDMYRAEPDQCIQDHAVAVIDMQHLIAGLLAVATDPVVAAFAEVVEPGEAEVAQVEELMLTGAKRPRVNVARQSVSAR